MLVDNDVESFLPTVAFAPNRRMSSGITMQGQVRMLRPSSSRESMRMTSVHPFVQSFTSPIGMCHLFFGLPPKCLTLCSLPDFVDDQR